MSQQTNELLEFGDYRLDIVQGLLIRGDEVIPLAPKAFATLRILVENPGRVVEKEEFLKKIWPGTFVEEGSLPQNISVVRKALGDNAEGENYIETVPKRGYRFLPAVRKIARAADALGASQPLMAPEVGRAKERSLGRRLHGWDFAVALLGLGLGLGWTLARLHQPNRNIEKPLVRLDVDLGTQVELRSAFGSNVMLSPDGSRLVYVSRDRLFSRRLDQPEATELKTTEGASAPFFSPDGSWIGFSRKVS